MSHVASHGSSLTALETAADAEAAALAAVDAGPDAAPDCDADAAAEAGAEAGAEAVELPAPSSPTGTPERPQAFPALETLFPYMVQMLAATAHSMQPLYH